MNSFTLTFKTPDVLDCADLTDEQKEYAELFIKYGELITIEFDGDTAKAVAK